MERFLQPGRGAVATVYGPISFPPQPVLLFRASDDGAPALVATGALASAHFGVACPDVSSASVRPACSLSHQSLIQSHAEASVLWRWWYC